MAVLWINGVEMPTPSALTPSKEKIWSSNAGRGSTGKFVGDLIAIKYKLTITWPTMTQAQSAALDDAVSDAFFDVKFIDPSDSSGGFTTKTMYAGSPSYPVYSYVSGFPRYKGVAIDLVEQ